MSDNQGPVSAEELLSAYFDGELAGDELAQAEKLLEQPENRQILADLKAMGDELRRLPRATLGEAFAERVIRKAERRVLAEAHPVAAIRAPAPVLLAVEAPSTRSAQRRAGSRRPWIYAAAVAAAGLLVAIVSWPRHQAKQFAEASHAQPAQADAGRHLADSAASSSAASPAQASAPVAPAALADRAASSEEAADKLVRLLRKNSPALVEDQSLVIWSCAVSPDALEQNALAKVLEQHQLKIVEQESLAEAGRTVEADKSGSKQPVAAILVSGDAQQIAAALADIRSQSAVFQDLTNLGRKSGRSAGEKQAARPAAEPAKRKAAANSTRSREAAAARGQAGLAAAPEAAAEKPTNKAEGSTELNLFLINSAPPASPP